MTQRASTAQAPNGSVPAYGRRDAKPYHFGLLIIRDFALMPFAGVTESLRLANWLAGMEFYKWTVLSEDGKAVEASSGLAITPHCSVSDALTFDAVIVIAGGKVPPEFRSRKVFSWLQRLARNGCRIGAAGLGSFVLARAGLLDGYRCTVHWKLLPNFRSEFPKLNVTSELYEIDRTRYTSSGGTGTLDMMLALITTMHGPALAADVAEEFTHDRIRPSYQEQRMSPRHRFDVSHPKLLKAVTLMENAIEEPVTCREIASESGISVRQLEKLFNVYLSSTPRRFYQKMRLDHARRLLGQTSMSVLEVGTATGFSSPSHFSRAYRTMFGKPPRKERAQMRGVAASAA